MPLKCTHAKFGMQPKGAYIMLIHTERETYLQSAVEELRPSFSANGHTLPLAIRVKKFKAAAIYPPPAIFSTVKSVFELAISEPVIANQIEKSTAWLAVVCSCDEN